MISVSLMNASTKQPRSPSRLLPALLIAFLLFANIASRTQDAGGNDSHPPRTGVLLMAHGGSKEWNAQVLAIQEKVNSSTPAEVAFGMADRSTLQVAVDKLSARGVTQIVAVPLFISSHSSVYDSLAFLLGVRAVAPKDLNDLTSMDHGMPEMNGSYHGPAEGQDKNTPIHSPVPVRMTAALDAHPLVGDILADRAAAISRNPRQEVVILVAHGPVDDAENALWLKDMKSLADDVQAKGDYVKVECVTLRDDAEQPIRNQATEELRRDVDNALRSNYRVLVVPLLLAYGGIDAGLRKRLDGLDHTMSMQALLPDPRIVTWILESMGTGQSVASKGNL